MDEGTGMDSLIVPLGISAIDVLCCAMICSFVLFLVFANAADKQRRKEVGPSVAAIVIRLVSHKPGVEFNISLTPPPNTVVADEVPTLYFSDQAQGRVRKAGLQKGGSWKWIKMPDLGDARDALLIVERPITGQWHASVSYSASSSLEDADLIITMTGRCPFKRLVILHPAQTLEFDDLPSDGSCAASDNLQVR
jgi:hypothetical protein